MVMAGNSAAVNGWQKIPSALCAASWQAWLTTSLPIVVMPRYFGIKPTGSHYVSHATMAKNSAKKPLRASRDRMGKRPLVWLGWAWMDAGGVGGPKVRLDSPA